ncbi:MAG: MFS transporter [Bacilli bacterium]|nr:MFS transporter [Bacilli bacterium]
MKLDNKKTIFVGFAFFIIMMFWQVYDNIIAKILINSFGLNQTMSGVVMALDNILAVVLLPIFGVLSDRTKTKYGKRTPYIFFGTLIAAGLIMGISIFDNAQLSKIKEAGISEVVTVEIGKEASNGKTYEAGTYEVIVEESGEQKTVSMSLENEDVIYLFSRDAEEFYDTKEAASDARSIFVREVRDNHVGYYIGFIVVLFLILVAMAVFRTPAVSLMPDITPKPLRSKGNAIINLMGAAGGVTALGFMTFISKDYQSYTPTFVCLGILMLLCLAVFMLKVKENKWVEEMEQQSLEYGIDETEEVLENNEKVKMPKDVKQSFILILLAVAFWYMAYNAATSKFSVYAGQVLDTGFTMPLMIANAAAIVSYAPIGILSSKYGRKKMVIVGVIILFLAFLLGSFVRANSAILIWVVMALAGIGWATINVNSYPMVVEMSRSSDIGKYTGIYYTASMAAQIATPVLSGFFMDIFNMTVLFPYCVVFCVLAFIMMLFVKHGDSEILKK